MPICVRWRWWSALLPALLVACATADPREVPQPTSTATEPPATATAAASATAQRTLDIRATRLVIPSLDIDAEVQPSRVIPVTSTPPPPSGCPARPPGETTLTVPEQGIATPDHAISGLENRAWIFGHSRWQNQPGLLGRLQDISVGDALYIDGVDLRTGEPIADRKFVVDAIYLTDVDSGGKLVTGESGTETPPSPTVILQTSVREDGAGKPWLFNEDKILAKSRTVIEGDLNDPCKYLLLFVFARS